MEAKYVSYKTGNKIGFRKVTGSDALHPMTKEEWHDYIHKLYSTLLLCEDKKGNMYKDSLEFYNAICKEFDVELK